MFLLKSQTIYSVHSPGIYALCTEVLGARLRSSRALKDRSRYGQAVYKLARHFGALACEVEPDLTLIDMTEPVMVFRRPYSSAKAERRWDELKADPRFRVSIDVFDYGVLLADHRLHRQHFMLRI